MIIKKNVYVVSGLLLACILAVTISILRSNKGELEQKIEYSSNTKFPAVESERVSSSGLLVAGKFTGPDGAGASSKPALVYIDPDNNFSLKNIDLTKFNFSFEGIHEARPIIVNNEYKIVLGTHHQGDENASTELIILNNANGNFDNLEVEFKEQVNDARIRAVFVEDIDGDGEKEVVIGTRPHGILKYYKFIENKWISFDIDFLNETIHDIVIADTNGNGRNEIVVTVSPLATPTVSQLAAHEVKLSSGGFTGRIISYEFDPDKNTWKKESVGAYSRTFPDSLVGGMGFFEHPRYIFAADIDGDGSKEIVLNVLGSQSIELFKWNGLGYSREIIEDKLDMHESAIAVGDIDNDGKDEVVSLTLPEHTLALYDYSNKSWKREILADDLREGENTAVRYLSILKRAGDSYAKIVYAVEPVDNAINESASNSAIFYLERAGNMWSKKYIDSMNRPMISWGIFSLSP